MDDGDAMCHPVLVPSCLHEFDDADAKVGAERTPQKTEVICYLEDVGAALGVAVLLRQFIADQLLAKADVTRAMHERVQVCQDPQIEFALLRESPGVRRISQNLRVNGHTILQENWAAEIYDEVGQGSLERLFPGQLGACHTQRSSGWNQFFQICA